MEVNGVNSNYPASAAAGTAVSNSLDKNAFLKILCAELSNQDPLNSTDNTQYISQLAQFSALEQSENSNETITNMLNSQRITEGSMLIGKNVSFNIDADNCVNEVVKSVKVSGTDVYLVTDNGTYSIDKVAGIQSADNA
jgi:flagellar basal-body rod modification protein FlgD